MVQTSHPYIKTMMSAGYSSRMLQEGLSARMHFHQENKDKQKAALPGKAALSASKLLFFIDDLSEAQQDKGTFHTYTYIFYMIRLCMTAVTRQM